MTIEERARLLIKDGLVFVYDLQEIVDTIRAAVLEEREACAQCVDGYLADDMSNVADVIRKRPQP